MINKTDLPLLQEMLAILNEGFSDLPPLEQTMSLPLMQATLQETAVAMQDNYPYHHPFYVGQMLKPPHPIARLAYALALWINPNNHALDGGRASSAMEKEVVAKIAHMFNWQQHLGHLTSGGTMANMEALWIAREETNGKMVVASELAHYTHNRVCQVLKIPFQAIKTDARGKLDLEDLKQWLDTGEVGTVVVTLGTTAVGSIDPLPDVLALRANYDFRIHVDTAYGGYFTLANNLSEEGRQAYDALAHVDSIAIDPHKHGLQPYGCGCVLFRDPKVGIHYKHDSGYTYFSSDELHLGEISLECSRAGASAVALWTTMKMFPLHAEGEFAQGLSQCRQAAQLWYQRLKEDSRFAVAFPPELDIVIWIPKGTVASQISAHTKQIFQQAAKHQLHMAVAELPRTLLESYWPEITWDVDSIACLRTCLMKPEHLSWLDRIWQRLDTVMTNES